MYENRKICRGFIVVRLVCIIGHLVTAMYGIDYFNSSIVSSPKV